MLLLLCDVTDNQATLKIGIKSTTRYKIIFRISSLLHTNVTNLSKKKKRREHKLRPLIKQYGTKTLQHQHRKLTTLTNDIVFRFVLTIQIRKIKQYFLQFTYLECVFFFETKPQYL